MANTVKPEGWKQDNRRHYEAKVFGKASPSKNAMKPKYPQTSLKEHSRMLRNKYAVSMGDIVKIHEDKGKPFFSRDSMRFFRSRLSESGYVIGKKAYFITSEQFHDQYRTAPRMYTVRVMDTITGSVSDIGEFNKLSKSEAQKLLNETIDEAIASGQGNIQTEYDRKAEIANKNMDAFVKRAKDLGY
jgi:hypothetical protein